MIHLHVRDEHGRHSLEAKHYRPAIDAIRQAVGDAMLIQVTSEAAGIYTPKQQISHIEAIAPDGVSVAIRELFVDDATTEASAKALTTLNRSGTLVQYILYDPADVRRYQQLLVDGAISQGRHWVLFVLGRYSDENAKPNNLDDYIAELNGSVPWMVCAFGRHAFGILQEAAEKGGHIRIGFENGWLLPDGSIAANNAALVGTIVERISATRRQISNVDQAVALLS